MEKEIKKTNISGNKFEDLAEGEMDQVQGQGSDDTTGETFITLPLLVTTVSAVSAAITITNKK